MTTPAVELDENGKLTEEYRTNKITLSLCTTDVDKNMLICASNGVLYSGQITPLKFKFASKTPYGPYLQIIKGEKLITIDTYLNLYTFRLNEIQN